MKNGRDTVFARSKKLGRQKRVAKRLCIGAVSVFYVAVCVAVPTLHPHRAHAETTTLTYDWSQYIQPITGAGVNNAQIDAIKVGTDGSVYAAGQLYGTADFDPKGAGDSRTATVGPAAFITKRNSNGSYAWTRVIEANSGGIFIGAFRDKVIQLDDANNVYLTGLFDDAANFNPTGSDVRTVTQGTNIDPDSFFTKWNADGTYGWTYTLESPAIPTQQHGPAVPPALHPPYEFIDVATVQGDGTVYLAGQFTGATDFNAQGAGDIQTPPNINYRGAYVTKINPNGSYGWTKSWGGDDWYTYVNQNSLTVAGDGSGIYAVLDTHASNIDIDPGPGVQMTTLNTAGAAIIVKLGTNGSFIWGRVLSNTDGSIGTDYIHTDSSGNFYAIGLWGGTSLDFDPTAGTDVDSTVSTTGSNSYILKLGGDGSYKWSKRFKADFEPSNTEGNQDFLVTNEGVYAHISFQNMYRGSWDINYPGPSHIINPLGDATSATSDVVVAKWDLNGNFEFAKTIGGPQYDFGYEMTVTSSCHAVYSLGESYGDTGGTPFSLDGEGGHMATAPSSGGYYLSRFSDRGYYTSSIFNATADQGFFFTRQAVGPSDSVYISGDVKGATVNLDSTGGSDLLNTNTKSDAVITKMHNTNYRQHVINLDGSVNAEELSTGDNARLGAVGVARTASTTVRVPDADNSQAIADITADLSCDRDWSGVSGNSDAAVGAAFIHGLTAVEGAASTLEFYVPKTGSDGVGLCPNATTTSGLNSSCAGYYEMKPGNASLTTTTIGGKQYWAVLGVSNIAGFNLGSPTSPATPATPSTPASPTPTKLVNTGISPLTQSLIGLAIVSVAAGLGVQHRYGKKVYSIR